MYGKFGVALLIVMGGFLALMVSFSFPFSHSLVQNDSPSKGLWPVLEARNLDSNLQKGAKNVSERAKDDGDLLRRLPPPFDENSCLSRYRSHLYGRNSSHHRRAMSPFLASKLRSYEARHKRCGPHTDPYNNTVQALVSAGTHPTTAGGCSYIVWIASSGLGNQILTIASTFLYALLTDRVLLVDRRVGDHDLFCEPFPETSWLLPPDFPLKPQFSSFNQSSPQSYGSMLKKKNNTNLTELAPQPYLYIHKNHDSDDHDDMFFCDQEQIYLHNIPWLVILSNNYFVPSLFLMPSFEQELDRLFPVKETVFHHLGQYLFHPTNSVWGLVTRYYDAYLSKSDVLVGLQIRVLDTTSVGLPQLFLKQIIACATRENILPEIGELERESEPELEQKQKITVLVTSLYSSYYEGLRDLYWEHPAATGESVVVFQPSNKGSQKSWIVSHNQKAWAEMYLLSLPDRLVTTSWSTFGYVAQGLAGLRPWILDLPNNWSVPDPPCKRGMSMEPCFHQPPRYVCNARGGVDTADVVPHVRHCEDRSWGIKLFNFNDKLEFN